jgi:hypothetical protein
MPIFAFGTAFRRKEMIFFVKGHARSGSPPLKMKLLGFVPADLRNEMKALTVPKDRDLPLLSRK